MSQSPNEINDLLESWGLADLKSKFKVNYIVLEALDYLTEADIKELIPKIGQRAIFRAKLNQWRQEKIKPPQLPTTAAASEENCVPEPKKIKLEPDAEEPTPVQEEDKQQQPRLESQQQYRQIPQEHLQQQQLQQEKQSAAIEQMILKAKAHLNRKGNVTPKNIIAKPTRGKRGPKKFVAEEINQVPTIQSRVQQFIIGSSTPSSTPSAATTTVSPQTAATPTGVCRISKITSPNNSMSTPRLTVVNPITSPSMFYNSPAQPMFEGRRLPTMVTGRLISPGVQQQQQPSPAVTKIKVIKSDNLSPPKGTIRITPANFDADLTPFATSIIRVETNDNESPAIGVQSAQNLLPKMKRTTIIQKLKDKNTSPLPISPPSTTQKPTILPKPIVQIQKLGPSSKTMTVLGKSVGKPPTVSIATLKSQLLAKSPVVALKRSPEVPKPKVIMIPKTEPVDEEEQSTKRKVKDWYSLSDKKGVDKSQLEPAEPDTVEESQHDDNEREEEMEMDPDAIPEIEEITLADPIAELPDAIKDEVLDSDSHSDPEADQEQDNSREGDKIKDDVSKENSYSKDSKHDPTELKGDSDKLDIRKVLTNSKCGRKVIKRYVAEEVLDETIRRLLIETIAFHCFENKIHITPTSCKDIAEQIIEIFPNERMEDYFHRKGKKLRSPLYTKYLGIRRESYRKQILKNSPNGKSTLTKENEYDEDDNLIIS